MALPTFTYNPTFSLDVSSRPRIERTPLGDGYVDHTPLGFRPNLRAWNLNFNALRLDEVQPIIDFLDDRGAYKMFQWTEFEPYKRSGLWLCPSYRVNRPDGVIFNLSATFEEQ